MKLYHVSEESNIVKFVPRKPVRKDMKASPALVWAIDEFRLPNFLTPRDCPRVTYHVPYDKSYNYDSNLFSSQNQKHVVAIESGWFDRMLNTELYIYEFSPENFRLQDNVAGYYVSEETETPINVYYIDNIFKELFDRNIEVRILDNLFELRDEVMNSNLNWSMCRMCNAKTTEMGTN